MSDAKVLLLCLLAWKVSCIAAFVVLVIFGHPFFAVLAVLLSLIGSASIAEEK